MDNSFAALYKSFSDAELLQIVEDKSSYQPAAVEAALREIESRRLTSSQWEAAKEELGALLAPAIERREKQQRIRGKWAERGNQILQELSPSSDATVEKKIRLMSYGMGFLLLYTLIKEYHLLWRILKDFGHWDTMSLLMVFPYVAVPLALYYFWHRHPVGWIVLTAWLTLSTISVLSTFIWVLKKWSGFAGSLFPPRSGMQYYIISLLIFGGLLLNLNGSLIRHHLQISRRTQYLTIGISATFIILLILI